MISGLFTNDYGRITKIKIKWRKVIIYFNVFGTLQEWDFRCIIKKDKKTMTDLIRAKLFKEIIISPFGIRLVNTRYPCKTQMKYTDIKLIRWFNAPRVTVEIREF